MYDSYYIRYLVPENVEKERAIPSPSDGSIKYGIHNIGKKKKVYIPGLIYIHVSTSKREAACANSLAFITSAGLM